MKIYSKDDVSAIQTLRNNLKDLKLDDDQKSSGYLIRWLRARDMDIVKAEYMLRKSLKWRDKENINNIFDWYPPIELQNFMSYKMCGVDNEGRPIVIFTMDCSYLDAFITLSELILKASAYFGENLEADIKLSSKNNIHRQAVYIYDLSGVEFLKLMTRPQVLKIFGSASEVFNENYPEIVKKVYITYAPKLFKMFFSMIKHFIPTHTLEKIKIYGENPDVWKANILRHIPTDQLPPRYGGTNFEYVA